MTLTKVVIGLMFFIVASLTTLGIVFDMYSSDGYDIDLSQDSKTAFLSDLQQQANASNALITQTNEGLWNNTIGQEGSNIQSGSITDGDLMRSAWSSLTNIQNYINVGTTMVKGLFVVLSLGTNSPLVGFIIGALTIFITFRIISSVLNKEL